MKALHSLIPHTFFSKKSFLQQQQTFYLCFGVLGASLGAFPARGPLWAARRGVWAADFLGEQIYLLFLQNSWLPIVSFIMPLELLKQKSSENTILFGSMLPSSSKWMVGVHVMEVQFM
jgi:hypothetical protein